MNADRKPELVIRIKKGRDGPDSLACVRPDGSATWHRIHPFFPLHDLCHLAVETVLELRQSFYGLIAQGWNLEDFSAPKDTRKPFPPESVPTESVVMFFQQEYAESRERAPEERDAEFAALPWPCEVSPAAAEEIRALVRELAARWDAVPVGENLEVPFPYPKQPQMNTDQHRSTAMKPPINADNPLRIAD
jgi:hypothetical protein